MADYARFDIIETGVGFPRDAYERKWASHHRNFVFAFFLTSILVLAGLIVLITSSAVGNTAHVLYPVTTDLSYETVTINRTSDEVVIYYNRELDYQIIGYVDITIMLCVSIGLDIIYYMQVLYTSNFHVQQVPIISTVSVWKWINYGFSGGVILLICALVVGVNDLMNLIYILSMHAIISGFFYIMERRNASLLRRYRQDGERIPDHKRKNVKWLYVVFPTALLVFEFIPITVYFVYLLFNSNGIGHIWFNIAVFFASQMLFVFLALMTIYTYYSIAVFERFRFSMMIPKALSRMFVTFMAKLVMFICIVVVSATDLPLKSK